MKTKHYINLPECSASYEEMVTDTGVRLDQSHCHDRYEILYITDGAGKYIVEGSEYDVVPRTLMFIRPCEYHCLKIDDGVPYKRYCIHLSPSILSQETAQLLFSMTADDDNPGNCFSPASLPPSLDAVFDMLDIIEDLSDDLKRIYTRAFLAQLIVILYSSASDSFVGDAGDLGARVIRYLNGNIDKNLSLDKLARRFFVSKYYLCRAFKKYSGISVHGYVNHKRVLYAKQLIEAGETASGAAYKVGFGDYSAFYRAYVRIVGKAPTQEHEGRRNETEDANVPLS